MIVFETSQIFVGKVKRILANMYDSRYFVLSDAFNKYDYTGDGRLSFKEFSEAWRDLGLKASGEEFRDAFNQVDMDKSGLVDVHEFKTAVKDNVNSYSFCFSEYSFFCVSDSRN